jgi:hypothetical protein
MKTSFVSLLLLSGALSLPVAAQSAAPAAASAAPVAAAPADDANVRSAIELIRADIRAEKALIIAQNIAFTPEEQSEFWPLYNEYNLALGQLVDERLALFKEFVSLHETMTNEQATVLAGKFFDWEAKRTELKRTWFRKFAEVIPARKAAQFAQIENQINAALDLLLQTQLPLIK